MSYSFIPTGFSPIPLPSFLDLPPPPGLALLFLSTVILIADVAIRLSHPTHSLKIKQEIPPTSSTLDQHDPLKTLATRANQVLVDCQELERRLATEKIHIQSVKFVFPSRTSSNKRLTTFDSRCGIKSTGYLPHECTLLISEAINGNRMNGAFAAFCERLLVANHFWKQERRIAALRRTLRSEQKKKCSNAFKAFCDRLILQNRIWKMEREAKALAEEAERMRKSRVAAVTRAAKRMMLDVRKDRLVEEFVKDLIEELEESKHSVVTLKEIHERELRELTEDWVKDYRGLMRETERLRLAQRAWLVEQEVSNEFEESLFDTITSLRRQALSTEQFLSTLQDNDLYFQDITNDLSDVSSFTCVSCDDDNHSGARLVTTSKSGIIRSSTRIGFDYRNKTRSSLAASTRRAAISAKNLPTAPPATNMRSPLLRKLDTGPYAGFSFNPLFFGNPSSVLMGCGGNGNMEKEAEEANNEIMTRVGRPTRLSVPLRPTHPIDRLRSITVDARSRKHAKNDPWRV